MIDSCSVCLEEVVLWGVSLDWLCLYKAKDLVAIHFFACYALILFVHLLMALSQGF